MSKTFKPPENCGYLRKKNGLKPFAVSALVPLRVANVDATAAALPKASWDENVLRKEAHVVPPPFVPLSNLTRQVPVSVAVDGIAAIKDERKVSPGHRGSEALRLT